MDDLKNTRKEDPQLSATMEEEWANLPEDWDPLDEDEDLIDV